MLQLTKYKKIIMESNGVKFNQNLYSVFAICEDFRQRLEQLQRLKENLLKEKAEEAEELK